MYTFWEACETIIFTLCQYKICYNEFQEILESKFQLVNIITVCVCVCD